MKNAKMFDCKEKWRLKVIRSFFHGHGGSSVVRTNLACSWRQCLTDCVTDCAQSCVIPFNGCSLHRGCRWVCAGEMLQQSSRTTAKSFFGMTGDWAGRQTIRSRVLSERHRPVAAPEEKLPKINKYHSLHDRLCFQTSALRITREKLTTISWY